MIHGQLEAALVSLKGMRSTDDAQRIAAVVVMLEEVLPEFTGQGHKPWRAIPWLDCASHLLQLVGATMGTSGAREHVSAARDLLERM